MKNFKLQTKYKQRLLCVYFCQTHYAEKENFGKTDSFLLRA